jgi:hypothetical protein
LLRLREIAPRFLLTHFWQLFEKTSIYRSDPVFEVYCRLIADSFTEITKIPGLKHQTGPYKSLLRDLFVSLSVSPRPIDFLILDGVPHSWGYLAGILCRGGKSALAAEIGGHLTEPIHRRAVLLHVLMEAHYDDALHYGLDQDDIFRFLVRESIARATETLMDENFVKFTRWLKMNGLAEAIACVEQALTNQGRTVELKRMRERLAVP